MITVDRIKQHEYTTIVDGNGGEEQIIIIATAGQSGHVGYRILHTAVDGGHWDWNADGVREVEHVRYGQLRVEDAPARIRATLEHIGLSQKDAARVVKKTGL